MHARLLSAPSHASAASSSLSFAAAHPCRASWRPRPTSPPPPLSLLRATASMHPSPPPEGHSDETVHGVTNTVVGVLGGGQLGKMLCQAASQMGVRMAILDPLEDCPASSVCHEHVVGSFNDGATVSEFAKRCGVLTVEIEHVDAVTLEKLEKQGIDCEPKASTIMIIQDKYRQKTHFSKFGIPLPDFVEVDTLSSIEKAGEMFGYPLMVKSKRLAYDGRGNAVAHDKKELSSVVASLGGFEHGLYVERWTSFVKELSVIVARSRDGSTVCYPVVETIHKDNICHVVEAPAEVPDKIKKLATNVAEKAIKSLEGAGVFAVELFLTQDNQVLLNEVAPRPHNSGHHTIESCYTSQYEQHLRAILGLPLGDPSMKAPASIMYNILGEDEGEAGFTQAHQLIERALDISGASVHWYAKPEIRKQRKMGHITIVGPSKYSVKARLDKLLQRDAYDPKKVKPRAAIIMGSDSDLPVMKDAAVVLKKFNIPFELTIVSAHRTPERMYHYALSAKERGLEVIIAGMVASLTSVPVIGVPIMTSSLHGTDSLLSIVQMPKGIPVATVAIGNAENAGLLAVRMLASRDPELGDKATEYQHDLRDMVLEKAKRLEELVEGWRPGEGVPTYKVKDVDEARRMSISGEPTREYSSITVPEDQIDAAPGNCSYPKKHKQGEQELHVANYSQSSNKMEKLIIIKSSGSGSGDARHDDGGAAASTGGGGEVETVRCACCGVAEECTPAYIGGVRAAFCGDWLCGLCSEAVKETARRDPAPGGGVAAALASHAAECRDFNATTRLNPTLSLAGSMRRIARRSFDKRTSASCQERRLGAAASRAVALARSASCDPRFCSLLAADVINGGAPPGDRCR
uniref:phosphoribosylaminoimidazole carboxylase n=1 Tax=Oryza meridionalis TaxID=40149 RepID=A0A0E0BYP1_9ORYZ